MKQKAKTKYFTLRCNDSEREMMKNVAKMLGRSESELMRIYFATMAQQLRIETTSQRSAVGN